MNPLDSVDVLSPKIASCIASTPDVRTFAPNSACIDCYVAFENSSRTLNNCLFECLERDSSNCDRCRLEKGCDVRLYSCTGLPNPF